MFRDKRIAELLGLEYPIIQAPMAGASTPEMAAAASNAGCLGSLGCAMMSPAGYKAVFDASRALTNKPLNMNFFCHEAPQHDERRNTVTRAKLKPFYEEAGLGDLPLFEATHFPFGEEMLEAVLANRPGVVSFHFGLPEAAIVERLKAADCVILSSATTPDEAVDLEKRGADAVIAQGIEAGGHQGYYLKEESSRIGTFALIPQVVDAVSVPVIAAGGIADGRGIVAALALGAAGVQIGTAFLNSRETGISLVHQKALLEADGSDTDVTTAFSGRMARGITNRYMREMQEIEGDLPDFPIMNTLTGPLRKKSADKGRPDFVAMWSGQAVGLNRESSVSELIETLLDETQAALSMLG